jgi:hypothetical protein
LSHRATFEDLIGDLAVAIAQGNPVALGGADRVGSLAAENLEKTPVLRVEHVVPNLRLLADALHHAHRGLPLRQLEAWV